MLQSLLARFFVSVWRFATSDWKLILSTGCLAGFYLVSWCFQFRSFLGHSLEINTAVIGAVTLGICLGLWFRDFGSSALPNRFHRLIIVQFFLAGWTIGFPGLMSGALRLLAFVPLQTAAASGTALLFAMLSGVCLLTLPVACLTAIACPTANSAADRNKTTQLYLLGISLGVFVSSFALSAVLGVNTTAQIVALISCVFHFVLLSIVPQRECVRSKSSAVAATLQIPSGRSQFLLGIGLAFLCGVCLVLFDRYVFQLMSAAVYMKNTVWLSVLLGVVCGGAISNQFCQQAKSFNQLLVGAFLFLSVWIALCLALFPQFIQGALELSSYVSTVGLVIGIRALFLAVLFLPFGVCLGIVLYREFLSETVQSTRAVMPVVAISAGMSVSSWYLLPMLGNGNSLAVAAIVLLSGALLGSWKFAAFPQKRLGVIAVTIAAVFAGFSPVFRANYQPGLSAKLLFSTGVFVANSQGVDRKLLSVLDEGRLLAIDECAFGTQTIWKYRGSQIQVRENGIPHSIFSADNRICPSYSAEVLTAAVPLILHEAPHRVLCLGFGSGEVIRASLSFPVQSLNCFESDRARLQSMRRMIQSQSSENFVIDERLHLYALHPAIGLNCQDESYDVIFATTSQASVPHVSSMYTREFYESVSGKLASDGIFCQRFRHVDFGPKPMLTLFNTLKSVFRDIVTFESAPGETLFVATNSIKGVIREDLMQRAQSPQARYVLSHLGWDWTVILNLSACGGASWKEISAKNAVKLNTAENGQFSFLLPTEVLRWGPKNEKIQQLFAGHSSRIIDWLGEDKNDPVVLRRLSEVMAQRKLMSDPIYQDRYWAYRKTVREELTLKPRTLIQQVKSEIDDSGIHSEDQRRMDYFDVLSQAKQKDATAEDAFRLLAFDQPYDPLLSYFLHGELSKILEARRDVPVEYELRHRLYSIYYADGADSSIRDVTAAIKLIAHLPETSKVLSPEERWDHLNALLQMLTVRWENRRTVSPESSRIALVDIEKSVSSAEQGVAAMERLWPVITQPAPFDHVARKTVILKNLIRPLRTYRSTVMPHHYRNQEHTKKLIQDALSD